MQDLISRQAAIDALKICDNNEDGINCHKCPLRDKRWDGAWQDDETNCYTKLMRDSAKLLELQSVQPERKKGKWTRHFDGNEWYWYCSSCKEQWYEEDLWMGGNSFPNFCPNCGCRMEEGDSE